MLAQCRQRGRLLRRRTQRDGEVLVDVGVEHELWPAERRDMAGEQRGQGGLAAAAFTHEGNLHDGALHVESVVAGADHSARSATGDAQQL